MRKATIQRETAETRIVIDLNLDGEGRAEIATGSGFFDHMLDHLARHALFDLSVRADGDHHIDAHHTVEDAGICLGKAFLKALGAPEGISRYGHAVVPMDETLAEAAVDVSGRPHLEFEAAFPKARVGDFDLELVEEFLRAFAMNARVTLHIVLRRGQNAHHCAEGVFKAFARALRMAVERDPRVKGVPSTKGMLET